MTLVCLVMSCVFRRLLLLLFSLLIVKENKNTRNAGG